MILFEDDPNIAFNYEGLARAVFNNCIKGGDPWGYAKQEFYSLIDGPNLKFKRGLSTVLIKMILDHPDTKETEYIKELEQQVWDSKAQIKIIEIIEKAIDIAKKLGYGY